MKVIWLLLLTLLHSKSEENAELPEQSLDTSANVAIPPASESTDENVETIKDAQPVVSSSNKPKYR